MIADQLTTSHLETDSDFDIGADFAVVIGLNYYPNLGDLKGAEPDALAFAEWLRSEAEVPPCNIQLITSSMYGPVSDALEARPNCVDVDRPFRRLLALGRAISPKRVGRRLYIFLAGHGFSPDWDTASMFTADALNEDLGFSLPGRPAASVF